MANLGKGGIAGFQSVSGLPAHARRARREGDRLSCGEGDKEQDGAAGRPFARATRPARAGEEVQVGGPVLVISNPGDASTGAGL